MHRAHSQQQHGFTIVELLVVIVMIGILAAVTIVAYTGISQKAVLASLQSDLSTSAQRLKMYQVENGTYPQALDGSNCPVGPTDTRYCLKPSPGNTFAYSSSSPFNTFSLVATNASGISYQVTDNSQPTALAPAPLSPVADWLATAQGDHYGNYYDLVGHGWANVTRTTPKTVYDPNDGRIHDVPAGYLAMNPWSAYQSGGRGSAAVVEEARTNYLLNSYGAANDGSAWHEWSKQAGGTGTVAASIVPGLYGTTAQRLTYTGVAGDSNSSLYLHRKTSANSSFASGESAYGSYYIKGSASGVTSVKVQVLAWTADRAAFLGQVDSAAITLTNQFVRVGVAYSSLPATTSSVELRILCTGIDAGDTIDITIDAAQLEKGAFATSYIPTTTTTATRNADVVTVPTTGWNAATTTVVAVAGVHPPTSGSSLFSWRTDVGNRYHLYRGSLAQSVATCVSGGVPTSVITNDPPARSGVAAGVWQASGINAYSNDTAGTQSAAITIPTLPVVAYLGQSGNTGGIEMFNGPIARLTVYASALSSSDILTVTNAVQSGP